MAPPRTLEPNDLQQLTKQSGDNRAEPNFDEYISRINSPAIPGKIGDGNGTASDIYGFNQGGTDLVIYDPEKGIPIAPGVTQKFKPDGSVQTTINGDTITYHPDSDKYTNKDGAEIAPENLPELPAQTSPPGATGDKALRTTQYGLDGNTVIVNHFPVAGQPSKRTVFHPNNADGLVEYQEFPGGNKERAYFNDGRVHTAERTADGIKITKDLLNSENKLAYSDTAYFDPTGKPVKHEVRFSPLKLSSGQEATALRCQEGQPPVFLDNTGNPIMPKNETEAAQLQSDLKNLLSRPLHQITLANGDQSRYFADGRRETEHFISGASPGPDFVTKTVDYPPSNELGIEKEITRANGTSSKTSYADKQKEARQDPPPQAQAERQVQPQPGQKGKVVFDGASARPSAVDFTEGEFAGQGYKFAYNDGGLDRITLPKSANSSLPEGAALQKVDGTWRLVDATNQPINAEVDLPGFRTRTDAQGCLAGQLDVSKAGEIRHKNGHGIETVIKANGDVNVFNMKDYSCLQTKANGEQETFYWTGNVWHKAKEVRTDPNGATTVTFAESSDANVPISITRIPGPDNDPEAGQLIVERKDGTSITADWHEQTQMVTGADKQPGPLLHFDGSSYRQALSVEENKETNTRTIRFANDNTGPTEVSYNKSTRETISTYRQKGADGQESVVAVVTRNGAGFVTAVEGPQGKTQFIRDQDGDIRQVILANGITYNRIGQERIPGQAAALLRKRYIGSQETASYLPPELTNLANPGNAEGYNHWEGTTKDGQVAPPLDGNFLVTNDGTINISKLNKFEDKQIGVETLISPSGIVELRSQGTTLQISDASGTTFHAVNGGAFMTEDSPQQVGGKIIKMSDGTIRFRTEQGDFVRNQNDSSFSLVTPLTNMEDAEPTRRFDHGAAVQLGSDGRIVASEAMRRFDHGGAIQYAPDGRVVATESAKIGGAEKGERQFFSYNDQGKVSKITSEPDGNGRVIAAVDEAGNLQEMDASDPKNEAKSGRTIEFDPKTGMQKFSRNGVADGIKTLENITVKFTAAGGSETTLPNNVKIFRDKDQVITAIQDPAGKPMPLTYDTANKRYTSITLPNGVKLDASDKEKYNIKIDPDSGMVNFENLAEECATTYGPNGTPIQLSWVAAANEQGQQFAQIALEHTGQPGPDGEIAVTALNGTPLAQGTQTKLKVDPNPANCRLKITTQPPAPATGQPLPPATVEEIFGNGIRLVTTNGVSKKFDRSGKEIPLE